ncbi:MAG TPA: serine hydrolase domain-containing protein [Hyphomicrobiaceae bacterium]|jgi:CubicO group peptidase (beta-lactamase class C family)
MKTRIAVPIVLVGLFLSLSPAALADPLPATQPQTVGLSKERLNRITETLKASIAKGDIPGAVLLISRHGKIAYFEAMGSLDPEKKTPMSKDAIFRIYSMTKPIAAAAAMMLFEEGKLALNDPVAKYIPAFKDVKVGEEKPGADGKPTLDLVAPKRAMTIQDLMRHSSGLTYGFFGEGLVKKAYVAAKLGDGDPTAAEFVDRLAKLPLVYHPGTTWDYSQSTDVLGRVIEVVTGKPLYQALKAMLLDPLGMTDTSFYVTDPARQARIAEPFAKDRSIGAGADVNDPRIAMKYESAGGGLVGTATDYARFLQMLANGGRLDGKRYLSPRTLAYMTSDHMGDVVKRGPYDLMGPGYKFGLGFGVRTDTGLAPYAGSAGDYYWGGAGGTAFWVDPKEKMFVVFMMQAPSKRLVYRVMLRNMVYAAIVE